MSELQLNQFHLDYLFSPVSVRDRAGQMFEYINSGRGHFVYHHDQFKPTVDYVLSVIRAKYPDLRIPFHSRWGHFRAGGIDRVWRMEGKLQQADAMERLRAQLDLVITSVLLDAGAGPNWSYFEDSSQKSFSRSEGLGVASFYMFLGGALSGDGRSLRADAEGLNKFSVSDLKKFFQVSNANPLLGVEGRVGLINSLARAVSDKSRFRDGRPGNIADYLLQRYGRTIPAPDVLLAVIEGFGSIWPGRLSARGRNLGDVWRHSKLNGGDYFESLVPFHKLSQWMTYSLIEPMREAGLNVPYVEKLTGLAEYRNGGLIMDSGLITLAKPELAEGEWRPDSDLVIEWRALTVYLLDRIADEVRKVLGKSEEEFPLAKVLEGGTWWAGRQMAGELRKGGEPPLRIESDGTVF